MNIGWGKPTILAKDLDDAGSKWIKVPTPVENSSNLETTKGEKKTAPIEGGENEDVRYGKNTYAFKFQVRAAKGRNKPIKDEEGVVQHNYALAVIPEDSLNSGFVFDKSTVSVSDTFTSSDGGIWEYTFDALKKDAGTPQITWGTITYTKTGDDIEEVKIDPIYTDSADPREVAGSDDSSDETQSNS